jgi:hypothetical protein
MVIAINFSFINSRADFLRFEEAEGRIRDALDFAGGNIKLVKRCIIQCIYLQNRT